MTTKGGVSQPYLFKLVFKLKKKHFNKASRGPFVVNVHAVLSSTFSRMGLLNAICLSVSLTD